MAFRVTGAFMGLVPLPNLRLLQLQSGSDAFKLSLLLLAWRFLLLVYCCLCLGARFEELCVQTLKELEGVIEQISPVVERPRYDSEEKNLLVVAGIGFKRCL